MVWARHVCNLLGALQTLTTLHLKQACILRKRVVTHLGSCSSLSQGYK